MGIGIGGRGGLMESETIRCTHMNCDAVFQLPKEIVIKFVKDNYKCHRHFKRDEWEERLEKYLTIYLK